MTHGNKEHLEALSPEGKLFPLKAKEWPHPLSLVSAGFPKPVRASTAVQWRPAGEEAHLKKLRAEGTLKAYSLNSFHFSV